MGGILGLDLPAFYQTAERMEILIDRAAVLKLKALEAAMLKHHSDTRKKQTK